MVEKKGAEGQPLFDWAKNEQEKELEKKRELEREENNEEEKKLHRYGRDVESVSTEVSKPKKIETNAEFVEKEIAHKEALKEDLHRTLERGMARLRKITGKKEKK
ncbi:MAG: hypothetical protein WC725_00895 [Patescibacteria group bacterium]|jgi:hypothetical protein